MVMAIPSLIKEIGEHFGLEEEDLMRQSLLTFLMEKKRSCLQDRLELLSRYGVMDADELEERIARGVVQEHPAWEDVIVIENLEAEVERLDRDIERLSAGSDHRPADIP
jgi:hypothetical protein